MALRWRKSLPAADPADIDMDEVGTGIIANAAALLRQRRGMNRLQRPSCDANIDRHALHVEALGRNAGMLALSPQHGVGPGGAVAGDHADRLAGFQPSPQGGQKVQQFRGDRVNLSRPKVTQHMVYGSQRVRQVTALGPIVDLQFFAGMDVVE